MDQHAAEERVARRWSRAAVALAALAVLLSIPAIAGGLLGFGFVLAIAAAVIATYVRLGLVPFSRTPATVALALSGVALMAHLFIYTAGLLV